MYSFRDEMCGFRKEITGEVASFKGETYSFRQETRENFKIIMAYLSRLEEEIMEIKNQKHN